MGFATPSGALGGWGSALASQLPQYDLADALSLQTQAMLQRGVGIATLTPDRVSDYGRSIEPKRVIEALREDIDNWIKI